MTSVELSVTDSVAVLVFHNEAKRNAFSHDLISDLIRSMDEAQTRNARVVILRTSPGRSVWSAGHDIDDIAEPGTDPLEWGAPILQLIRKIQELPIPVIALVEGTVWGGACELVFSCDLAFVTPSSTFALTPARLGVPYNVGGMLNLLNIASPKLVREMLYTAAPIPASRLLTLGVINQIVEPEQIEGVTLSAARAIAANSPMAITVMKEELRHLSSAQSLPPLIFDQIQGLRKKTYMSRDYREGLQAFKEKRLPKFTGE